MDRKSDLAIPPSGEPSGEAAAAPAGTGPELQPVANSPDRGSREPAGDEARRLGMSGGDLDACPIGGSSYVVPMPSPSSAPVSDAGAEKCTILVVDDSLELLEVLQLVLGRVG